MKKLEKVERFEKASKNKESRKQLQKLERLKKEKAGVEEWLEVIKNSEVNYNFYLDNIGCPNSEMLIALLNNNDEESVFEPLLEKAKQDSCFEERLKSVLKKDIKILEILANNFWYSDFVEKVLDTYYEEIFPKLDDVSGNLYKIISKRVLKDENVESIILGYNSYKVKYDLILKLIFRNAIKGNLQEMFKHIEIAKKNLGVSIQEIQDFLSEKSKNNQEQKKNNIEIAQEAIKERFNKE